MQKYKTKLLLTNGKLKRTWALRQEQEVFKTGKWGL